MCSTLSQRESNAQVHRMGWQELKGFVDAIDISQIGNLAAIEWSR